MRQTAVRERQYYRGEEFRISCAQLSVQVDGQEEDRLTNLDGIVVGVPRTAEAARSMVGKIACMLYGVVDN